MKDELELLKTTLEFYADKDNRRSPSTGFAAQYDPEPSPMSKDDGSRARAALYVLESLATKADKKVAYARTMRSWSGLK
jgi:hypothetical protein